MNDILVKLDEYDKIIVNDLCAEYICGSRIILEDYISVENLLGLLEELQIHIESLEKDKEKLTHQLYHPEDYDDTADRLYEERKMGFYE